jgi:hypothetical protein
MRQVTKNAYNAFMQSRKFSFSNTKVTIKDGDIYLYLFGNCIAKKYGEDIFISDGDFGYSRTTVERLSPFTDIKSVKKEFILKGESWNGNWTKIN